jgi:hypothetical protein
MGDGGGRASFVMMARSHHRIPSTSFSRARREFTKLFLLALPKVGVDLPPVRSGESLLREGLCGQGTQSKHQGGVEAVPVESGRRP